MDGPAAILSAWMAASLGAPLGSTNAWTSQLPATQPSRSTHAVWSCGLDVGASRLQQRASRTVAFDRCRPELVAMESDRVENERDS